LECLVSSTLSVLAMAEKGAGTDATTVRYLRLPFLLSATAGGSLQSTLPNATDYAPA
jgi:hypothetical protein